MPYHVISTTVQEKLRRQRRWQLLESGVVGLALTALFMGLLSVFLLATENKGISVAVDYRYETEPPIEQKKKKPREVVKKKPTTPPTRFNKAITSIRHSSIALPVPEVDLALPSIDFGFGDEYGSGWTHGPGGTKGHASFFNRKTTAHRVAYVIDFSLSMEGYREELMRAELNRSLEQLTGEIEYALIFFGGPAWVAGDDVELVDQSGNYKVTHGKDEFEWEFVAGARPYVPKDNRKLPRANWLKPTPEEIRRSKRFVRKTPLVLGTVWEHGIDMALGMNPKPDVIFFMTDGVYGDHADELAGKLGNKAKEQGVIIHTVAMMEPETKEAMLTMAQRSGGEFTLIKQDGAAYDKDGKPIGNPTTRP